MITWGISSESHNAALSVFANDILVFASESERFSGIKNDAYLNDDIINYALKFGKPELVCWYENPYKKTLRQLLAGQGWIENVKKYVDAPIKYYDHHYTHACAGYFTSKFDECCVVVIDAIGEFQTLTIWEAKGNNLKLKFQRRYPHSIGLWYSAMTQRCGLKPNEEEYILMGMSAYGDKRTYEDDIYDDFVGFGTLTFRKNLHKGCANWRPDIKNNFDIAAATQSIYETMFRDIMQTASNIVDSRNLVLMGGCALNCVANPIAYYYFDDVWIMPAPGDNGSAIGAVLAHKKKHIDWHGPYLGYHIKPVTTNEIIVDYLLEHKLCGLARGRAEFGPRALGNRSLLADPCDPNIKSIVNDIKQRQQFRPFAPVILEEYVHDYFRMPTNASPYMQYAVKCKKSKKFPAIVHIDKTSRVQTVNRSQNAELYDLLKLWHEKTGCPMLLNTSLNIKGKPMVNDEKDCNDWEKTYGIKVFS
jgi:carbamoyltransferase